MGRSYLERLIATLVIAVAILQKGAATEFHISNLDVPANPIRFTNQTLTCTVELGGYKLYFIKWYHNDQEIFRYFIDNESEVPDEPMKKAIDNEHVNIIVEESTGEKLVLREVDLSASGTYTCETNSAYPLFHSDKKNGTMTVVVLPEEQPNIEGATTDHYAVGDKVDLNCTSAPSAPAALLVWYINNDTAPAEYTHEYDIQQQEDGLKVSRLGLTFELAAKHFINGELKLKCTATIATLYHSSDEHSQQDPKSSYPADVLPKGGSLVTSTDPTSGASLLGRNSRLLSPLHSLLLLLVSIHLLR